MRARIQFTAEQLELMKRLAAESKSSRDIADAMGCGRSTILSTLANLGVKLDAGRAISKKMTGRPGHRLGAKHTPEALAKLSASLKGRPAARRGSHTPETLAKMGAALKGKNLKWTPEEKLERERVRQLSKRLVRRVLKATGVFKTIPSEKMLGYSSDALRAHIGPKPSPTHELDHYVPVAEFLRRGITCPSVIDALPNLRWLEGAANKKKRDVVPADAEQMIERCLSHGIEGVGFA